MVAEKELEAVRRMVPPRWVDLPRDTHRSLQQKNRKLGADDIP